MEQTGLKETVDGEIFSDALKSGSPFLKSELFLWLAEKLKDGESINPIFLRCLKNTFQDNELAIVTMITIVIVIFVSLLLLF